MKQSIFEVVHESAKDLHEAGLMDTATMRKFDAMCLTPVKELKPKDIKRIRVHANVSQAVLALYLNTSVSTVQQWERGDKHPRGIALKMLNLISRKGLEAIA